jgi:hypothetical protein
MIGGADWALRGFNRGERVSPTTGPFLVLSKSQVQIGGLQWAFSSTHFPFSVPVVAGPVAA